MTIALTHLAARRALALRRRLDAATSVAPPGGIRGWRSWGSIAGTIASAIPALACFGLPRLAIAGGAASGRTSEAGPTPPAEALSAVLVARFETMASSLETPARVGKYARNRRSQRERQQSSSNPSRLVVQNLLDRQRRAVAPAR